MTNAKTKINNHADAERIVKKTHDKSPAESKIESLVANEILRVANVARELNINEKRARAFLRHPNNVATYDTFRNKTFTRDSSIYKTVVALLTSYKQRTAPITK